MKNRESSFDRDARERAENRAERKTTPTSSGRDTASKILGTGMVAKAAGSISSYLTKQRRDIDSATSDK
jgi:hypothetical protein